MKITEVLPEQSYARIKNVWRDAAEQVSLESGILISVFIDIDAELLAPAHQFSRIYFKVDDHEFDSLKDLRKALNLKAFL